MARSPARRRERSERIQIYLIPSVEPDALVLDVWKAAMAHARPQDFFRDLLYKAIRDGHRRGDIPPEIVRRCRIAERVAEQQTPPISPFMSEAEFAAATGRVAAPRDISRVEEERTSPAVAPVPSAPSTAAHDAEPVANRTPTASSPRPQPTRHDDTKAQDTRSRLLQLFGED